MSNVALYRRLVENIPAWQLHVGALGMLFITTIFLLLTFPFNEATVILHYSVGVGIDFIGHPEQIKTIPILGALIWVLNVAVGRVVYPVNRVSAWVLWSINPLAQCLLLLAYTLVWNLNR